MLVLPTTPLNAWDHALFLWLNLDARSPHALVSLALLASQRLPGAILAGLGLATVVGPARTRRTVLTVALAMALGWTGAMLLKHWVTAPRPFMQALGTDWLGHSGGNGFPSSHASVAAAMAVAAWRTHWARALRVGLVAAAALVAWSRIALGVHFPSDVMAAVLLGSLCALIVQAAVERVAALAARAAAQRALRRRGAD